MGLASYMDVMAPAESFPTSGDRLRCVPKLLKLAAPNIPQTPTRHPVAPEEFRRTVLRAGIIFIGTVSAVQSGTKYGEIPMTYLISFRVKEGLRGVSNGALLTIREWAGLWGTAERYRVGECVVLFLYPASRDGVTSPVGGERGKLAVSSEGVVVLPVDWADSWARTPRRPQRHPRYQAAVQTPLRVSVARLAQRIREAQGN